MASKENSQSQQIETFWTKLAQQNLERINSAYDEWAKFEKKGVEQATQTFDEMSRLWKASVEYQTELAGHVRGLMLESTQKAFDFTKK